MKLMRGIYENVHMEKMVLSGKENVLTRTIYCVRAPLICLKPLIHYPPAPVSSLKQDMASSIANCAA